MNYKFNIVIIKTNDFYRIFDDVVLLIQQSLISLGCECSININKFLTERVNILVGSTIFASKYINLPDVLRGQKFILYQLEQLHDKFGLLNDWSDYYLLMKNATIIWDYSLSNVKYLQSKSFDNVFHLPPGYHPSLEILQKKNIQDIDVMFVGSLHPRRMNIINQLKSKNLNVVSSNNLFGEQRNSLISRSKILLNIHAWEDLNILETVRLSFLLANNVFVISEIGDHDPYGGGVVFCEYSDIVNICEKYLSMDLYKTRKIANQGYDAIKKIQMTEILSNFFEKYSVSSTFFESNPIPTKPVFKTRTLDIGCGSTPRNPLGLDLVFGVDIESNDELKIKAADLAVEAIPYESDYFDCVSAYDFLEHIPRIIYMPQRRFCFVELMNEIYRVLKMGGKFISYTPAFPAPAAFRDPTHVNIITEETFPFYFDDTYVWARRYGFKGGFKIIKQEWAKNKINLITVMQKI